ncbi:MAG: hypothetical protein AB8G22_23605 [Saprospiraceae bacterium]
MENNYNTEKIEAYVANRLNEADRATFEDEMVRDSGLELEVQNHALEREAIKLMLQDEYKNKIKGWLASASDETTVTETATEVEEIETTTPTPPPTEDIPPTDVPVIKLEPHGERTNEETTSSTPQREAKVVKMGGLRRVLSLAASVLLLVFAGSYFYASNQFASESIIGEGYLTAESAGDRSGEVTTSREFSNGLQAYFAGEFDLAQAQLEGIAAGSADYAAAQYYLGHIALQEKNYQSANQIFGSLLGSQNLPNFINRDKLRYNRLLAMVGYGNTGDEFESEVTALAKNGSAPFNTKAAELQAKTQSFWYGLIN